MRMGAKKPRFGVDSPDLRYKFELATVADCLDAVAHSFHSSTWRMNVCDKVVQDNTQL
jgi:aspartyl-tRNA synthetase